MEAPPPFDSRTDMRALCDGALRMFFLLSGLVWASFMLYSHLFNNIELSQDGPPHGRKGGDDEAPAGLLGPAWLRLAFEMTGLPVNESSFDLHTVENWSLEKDAALPWSRFANAFSFGFIPIASNASSEASTALEVSVPQPTFAFTLGRAIFSAPPSRSWQSPRCMVSWICPRLTWVGNVHEYYFLRASVVVPTFKAPHPRSGMCAIHSLPRGALHRRSSKIVPANIRNWRNPRGAAQRIRNHC